MGLSPTETRAVKRLAIVAPDATSLLRQRRELLSNILERRHAVLVLVPETAAATIPALQQHGLAVATYPPATSEARFLADGKTVTAMAALLADWRAHVSLGTGAKTMLLAALAAKKAGVTRRVGLLTEWPAPMAADPLLVPGWSWRRLMMRGFKALDAVVFHNQGQQVRLQGIGVLPPALATAIVPGAGVDLAVHAMQPLPPMVTDGVPALNFAMISRKDASKGVIEFCKAARLVREKAPETRFVLAGPEGQMPPSLLQRYQDSVEIVGDQEDVRPLIAAAHVVVAPSWSDGPPRVLLEALAAGRPVITCDISGCRETVDERVNGVLVAPRDTEALAEAMTSFLKRPDLIPAMARASRAKAERRFDVRAVNDKLMDVLGL